MDIGLKIKELRMKKNLSVVALADKIGVDRAAVYAWEGNRVRPRPEKLEQLAQILETSIKEFSELSITKNQQPNPQSSNDWFQKLVDDLQEEKRRLMDQNERLTRLLELQLGKFNGCPFRTADSPFLSIWKNEESVEESVVLEPVLQRA